MNSSSTDVKELRKFGLILGAIFALIGLWPALVRGASPRLWALAVAALLVLPALGRPAWLQPAYRAWMALSRVLGWVNTRLILGLVFFALVTPLGLAMRLFGRDALGLRFDRSAASYRVAKTQRPANHMLRQF